MAHMNDRKIHFSRIMKEEVLVWVVLLISPKISSGSHIHRKYIQRFQDEKQANSVDRM
jgi:hypothetical protein